METYEFIIILLFIISVITLIQYQNPDLIYIKSDIDNLEYLVENTDNKYKAVNLLSRIKQNIDIIVNYLIENIQLYKKYKKYINQLKRNIKNVDISENTHNSSYTSYSVNKGEEILFCLKSKKYLKKLHSLNLLMYVTLHELAHVACPEEGHTELFENIFKFFIQVAIKLKLYNKINFKNNNIEYCGIIIKNHI